MTKIVDFPKRPKPSEPGEPLEMTEPPKTGRVYATPEGNESVLLVLEMGDQRLEGVLSFTLAERLSQQLHSAAWKGRNAWETRTRVASVAAGEPNVIRWLRTHGGLVAAENIAKRHDKPLAWILSGGTTPEHAAIVGELWAYLRKQNSCRDIGHGFDVPTARVRKWAEAAASRVGDGEPS